MWPAFPASGVLRRLRPTRGYQWALTPTRHIPGWDAERESPRAVPVFTCFRSTRAAPSYTPVTPAGTPQHFPTGRRPPLAGAVTGRPVAQNSPNAHHVPTHIRQVLGRFHLTRPQPLVPCVCLPVLLATRTTHLAVLDRRGFVRAACHQTRPIPTGSAALSFTQITAMTRGSGSFTPIRKTRASRRTLSRW
jgi:hypothetical protein